MLPMLPKDRPRLTISWLSARAAALYADVKYGIYYVNTDDGTSLLSEIGVSLGPTLLVRTMAIVTFDGGNDDDDGGKGADTRRESYHCDHNMSTAVTFVFKSQE
ncbi:unnamed protein product, partial [Symbiodinium necroappetens]